MTRIMGIERLLQLTTLLCPLAALPAQWPAHDDPRFSAAAEAACEERRGRIREEIARLGGEPGWAGRYYLGDGTGVNVTLELAPQSGFVFEWQGCLGLYDRNHGTCTEEDGRVQLIFAFPNQQRVLGDLAPILVPVQWGERRYLIGSQQLPAFANHVNGGGEPRSGMHGSLLLRQGDHRKPVKGRPGLPAEAMALLLDEPVTGTIRAVHGSRVEPEGVMKVRITEATIDRGARHGLKPGHVVHFVQSGVLVAGAGRVVEVDGETARVRIRASRFEEPPVPEVGWQWSTRWRRDG